VHCSENVALKAEVINCTRDDGHVWCPKLVEAIKLHILSHLVGSLPFIYIVSQPVCGAFRI
jgi:hypothetical protein